VKITIWCCIKTPQFQRFSSKGVLFAGVKIAVWCRYCPYEELFCHRISTTLAKCILYQVDRIRAVMVHGCVNGRVPYYLVNHCVPLSSQPDIAFRSAKSTTCTMPWHQLSMYGRRAFAIAGPSAWNNLQDPVRNTEAALRRLLKTFVFTRW